MSVTLYQRKDELVALAYAASVQNLPVCPLKECEKLTALTAKSDYQRLLLLSNGISIPDPFLLTAGWIAESDGVPRWPPCMILNISDYLVAKNERPLCTL